MAIGYLTIQARTAHDALPLSGASVRILNTQGASVYELTTDENGDTHAIPLETLDKSFSLSPYYSGIPYTSYNVLVRASGFNSLYVADIPIYDGERAVLPVSAIPMQERQRSPIQAVIYVGAPAVSLTGARSQEEPSGTPYILRQVVIPDPITIHLGAPSAAAANVQVSFPDYVKNVASSEIYPTWPAAALTANIYAIITFALNRIYTEWYRSRNYEFDITNSPAYDQYLYTAVRSMIPSAVSSTIFLTNMCGGKGRSPLTLPPSAMELPPPVPGCPSGEPSHWRNRDLSRLRSCVPITQKISRSHRLTSGRESSPPTRVLRSEWAVPGLMSRQSRRGLHVSAETILPFPPSLTRKGSSRTAPRQR